MKLCWEVLDHLILVEGYGEEKEPRLMYYEDVYNMVGGKGRVEIKNCKFCGKPYLQATYHDIKHYCDTTCREDYREQKRIESKYLERLKIKTNRKKVVNQYNVRRKKEAERVKNVARYDSYVEKISWCEEVRRDPNEPLALQVKCCICGKWYCPTRAVTSQRAISVNDTTNDYIAENLFICSDACRRSCPKVTMSVDDIIYYDEIASGYRQLPSSLKGRGKYLQLFYDWQEDFRSMIKKEQTFQQKVNTIEQKKFDNKLKRERRKEAKERIKAVKKKERQQRVEVRRQERKEYEQSYEYRKAQTLYQVKKYNQAKLNDPKTLKLKRLLYYSRVRAKEKNLPNTLTFEWMCENTKDCCPKSGIEYSYDLSKHRNPFAPSIDRADITKGYTPGNCQIVSWIYNCAKCTFSDDVLYNVCKRIV